MSTASWQMGRTALVGLIVGYASVLPYHFAHLPVWLMAVALLSLGWQMQWVRQRWQLPGRGVRALLVALCLAGLLLEYRTVYSLELFTALLVIAFTLKFLELRRHRDVVVLVCLGIFITSLSLVFDQSAGRFFYTLASLVPWFAVLAALQGSRGVSEPARIALTHLLQSLPLMLVLFLVLPRLGGLWSMPLERHVAATGVSDTLSLGSVARLMRSDELAFWATFDELRPTPDELYWRGVVLTRFDGESWQQLPEAGRDRKEALPERLADSSNPDVPVADIERHGREIGYDVILQPTGQNWLFALDTPVTTSREITLLPDYRLVRHRPVRQRFEYGVRSWLDHSLAAEGLSVRTRQQNLSLPAGHNPQTVRRAGLWRSEMADELAFIERVLTYFNREFSYTLEPDPLGRHGVDDFLWRTRNGFCEHFASSFVVMMRAAGIPARVVGGYLGGEWHPDGYLMVRQYDAHAWAEVWLEGQGWTRIDPTAAVAPERVQLGARMLFSRDGAFLSDAVFSLQRYRDSPWLNRLRLQLNALDYYWARWVVGYHQQQSGLLERLLGASDPWRLAVLLVGAGAAIGLTLLFFTLRRDVAPARDAVDAAYLRFCERLASAGVCRALGEPPRVFAARAAVALPHHAEAIEAITGWYEQLRFREVAGTEAAQLQQAVRRFRPRSVPLQTAAPARH